VLFGTILSGCSVVGLPWSNVGGCYPQATTVAVAENSAIPLVRFVAMGDFGTAEFGRNAEVAAALREFLDSTSVPVERVFELGDNFYYHGLIGAGASCWCLPASASAVATQAVSVLGPFEFLRDRGITLTAIAGNHDYGCSGQGLVNQMEIDRWLPPAHRWGKHWEIISGLPHELTLGDGTVQVIVLDSERMITDRAFRRESAKRLETLLASGRERFQWRIIATHHPLHTNGAHDGAWWKGALPKLSSFVVLPSHALAALQVPPFDLLNQEVYAVRYVHYREAVEGAVRRSGVPVTLSLSGHDHQLQLLAPDAAGLPFTLVSGSAAKCAPTRAADDTIFAASKYGFAVVTAYAERVDVEFVGTTGCNAHAECAGNARPTAHRLFTYRIRRVEAANAVPQTAAAAGG
jgi:hypothetical protein